MGGKLLLFIIEEFKPLAQKDLSSLFIKIQNPWRRGREGKRVGEERVRIGSRGDDEIKTCYNGKKSKTAFDFQFSTTRVMDMGKRRERKRRTMQMTSQNIQLCLEQDKFNCFIFLSGVVSSIH